MNQIKIRGTSLILIMAMMIMAFAGCVGSDNNITIASKQFTENILLSEMYAQLVEAHTDIGVIRKQNLGGTSVCFPAIQRGEIDIYVEYSGTAYNEILSAENSGGLSSEEIYEAARNALDEDYNITMFDPIGINNTFALGMLSTVAESLGIKSMSDLSAHSSNLRFGANHLFYTRVLDGYDAMSELYGYNFSAAEKMDTSLLYDAASQSQLDVIVVYATDALLVKYDMVILEDDLVLFPAYHGAPICRNETLEKYPELSEVLNMLSNLIDDTTMQELDYQVEGENKTPEEAARQFLTEKGLL